MRPVTLPLLGLLTAALLPSAPAGAHEMRPGYLEIREAAGRDTESEIYDVLWKVPARGASLRLDLNLRFADDVEIVREPVGAFISGAHVQRLRVRRAGGLDGTEIRIDGLERTFTDVLLRLERADGTQLTHRLTPEAPAVVIEAEPGPGRPPGGGPTQQVAWTYFVLGVEHILGGIDHLLFVLALLLVVAGWRKLVVTVTAFTVAHSITLALATLGFVRVPGPPVEAVIALSIVFVAAEIVHGRHGGIPFVRRRRNPGLTARAPWIVAFTFGLLHGFGFAGALADVGLPQSAIPLALFTFNVGVEAGQLLFIAAMLAVYAAVRNVRVSLPDWAWDLPPYAIGSVAAFWMIERVAGFW